MTERPLRVLFFVSTLGGGGAEMHTLRLLQHFDRAHVVPMLAVARRGGSYEVRLPADVSRIGFFSSRARSTLAMLRSVRQLRRLVQRARPDVVCGVMELGLLVVLAATAGLPARPTVVGMIQVAPKELAASVRLGPLLLAGARHAYAHSDGIVALSEGVRAELVALDARLAGRTAVIPNAIVDDYLRARCASRSPRSGERRIIVACGRLSAQKDFGTLLRAVAQVEERIPVRLRLLGEGPDREALGRLAAELGISHIVDFLGFQANPFGHMASADLFVLSSRFEGFGNVIVEAMACGAPVVSTNCPHGPSEIIRHGVDGLLVPVGDARALAAAMGDVLGDPELHASLREHGLRRAEDYRAEVIAARYAERLLEVHRGRRQAQP